MIKVTEVTTDSGFLDLKEAWNELLGRSRADNIFLTWEWLYSWWQIFKNGRRLGILVAKEDGQIIGIAPLLCRTIRYFKILRFKRWELLASGEEDTDETCSMYLGFIIKSGSEWPVVEAFADHFKKNTGEWDEIALADMATDDQITTFAHDFDDAGRFSKKIVRGKCAYISLPERWENYLAGLGKNKRRNIKRDRRVLSEGSTYDFSSIDFSRTEDITPALGPMKAIHQREWLQKQKPGVFASSKFNRFVDTVSDRLARKGWVRLFYLKVNGKEKAFHYTLQYKNRICDYITGYERIVNRNIGMGTILLSHCIESAIDANIKEWDFLKSSDQSWKNEWSNADRALISILIAQKTVRGRLFECLSRGMHYCDALKRKIGSIAHPQRGVNKDE